MKKLIGMILFVSITVNAQFPACHFQWGDETCGLTFDDTNLTAEVKAVIRDDVGLIFSRIPTNVSTYIITNDVRYTAGLTGINGLLYYPENFAFGTYKNINGFRCFDIETDVSSKYLEAIALTNRHKVAVATVPTFLTQLESMRPGITTTNAYVHCFWMMKEERVFTLTDFGRHPEWITEGIATAKDKFFFRPSILDFSERTAGENVYLCFYTYMMSRTDRSQYKGMAFTYAQGAWRFFNPME